MFVGVPAECSNARASSRSVSGANVSAWTQLRSAYSRKCNELRAGRNAQAFEAGSTNSKDRAAGEASGETEQRHSQWCIQRQAHPGSAEAEIHGTPQCGRSHGHAAYIEFNIRAGKGKVAESGLQLLRHWGLICYYKNILIYILLYYFYSINKIIMLLIL